MSYWDLPKRHETVQVKLKLSLDVYLKFKDEIDELLLSESERVAVLDVAALNIDYKISLTYLGDVIRRLELLDRILRGSTSTLDIVGCSSIEDGRCLFLDVARKLDKIAQSMCDK